MSLPAESLSTCSLFELLDEVHGEFSVGGAAQRGARRLGCLYGFGRASTTKRGPCHPVASRRFWGLCGGSGRPPRGPAGAPGSAVRPRRCRQAATLAWSPEVSTSGIGRPSNSRRPGVLRVFQQPVGEAFLGAGGLLAHDAGHEPHAGVDQRQRRDLAARQHVVADRDLFELPRRDHPLVDALEAAADDDRAGPCGERRDARLRQRRAARRSSAGAGGRRPRTASMARASTSAFITMPGPPPAGVSSTVRCLSVA